MAVFSLFFSPFYCTLLPFGGLTCMFPDVYVCALQNSVFPLVRLLFQKNAAVERQRKSKCKLSCGFCDIVVCALCIACLYVFAGISALLCDVFRIKWLPLHRRVLYALDLITVIIKQ